MSANNPAPMTITFKITGGPITFQVQGDLATKGECSLTYRRQGTADYVLYPRHLVLQENKPDNVTFDLDPAELVRVRTKGRYAPAPDGSIVKVTYRFFQKTQLLSPGEMVFKRDNVSQQFVGDERAFSFVGVA